MKLLRAAATAFALAPALGACGTAESPASTSDVDASADGDSATVDPFGDAARDAQPRLCSLPQVTTTVPVPPPGIGADPAQLCGATSPVTSNAAAQITLSDYSATQETAKGFIAVPAPLFATVIGIPVVTVVSADPPHAGAVAIVDITPVAGGFSFSASWPTSIPHADNDGSALTLEVKLDVSCGDAGARSVTSITNLHSCIDVSGFLWVSSGGACTFCQHPPKA